MKTQIISQDRVEQVGAAMLRLEALLDEAMIVASELNTATVHACAEGRLAACFTQEDVFARAPALLAGLVETRGAAVAMHDGLARVGKRLNLALMGPPGHKGDDDESGFLPMPMGRQLHVVG